MAYNLAKENKVLCYDLNKEWKNQLTNEVKDNKLNENQLNNMIKRDNIQSVIEYSDTLITSLPNGDASKSIAKNILQ